MESPQATQTNVVMAWVLPDIDGVKWTSSRCLVSTTSVNDYSSYTLQTLEMRISIRGNYKQFATRNSGPMKEVMIADIACCTPDHTVQEAAEMMLKHDCGEIAVVENAENLKPIGVITDRDITWRVVATGKTPSQTSVRDAM